MLKFTCDECGETLMGITLKDLRTLVTKKKLPCGCTMCEADCKTNDEFLKEYKE